MNSRVIYEWWFEMGKKLWRVCHDGIFPANVWSDWGNSRNTRIVVAPIQAEIWTANSRVQIRSFDPPLRRSIQSDIWSIICAAIQGYVRPYTISPYRKSWGEGGGCDWILLNTIIGHPFFCVAWPSVGHTTADHNSWVGTTFSFSSAQYEILYRHQFSVVRFSPFGRCESGLNHFARLIYSSQHSIVRLCTTWPDLNWPRSRRMQPADPHPTV